MNASLLQFAMAQQQAALIQLQAANALVEQARASEARLETVNTAMEWVYIKKVMEITGLTKCAIQARVYRGDWLENKHYRREKDKPHSRLLFNLPEINQWMSGKQNCRLASRTTTAK